MKHRALIASTAVLALFLAVPANAQMQEKGAEQKGGPAQTQREQAPPRAAQPGPSERQARPAPQAQPTQKQAQPQPSQQQPQKQAQPAPKSNEPQKSAEPRTEKSTKGAAQRTEEKSNKGTAQQTVPSKGPNGAQTGAREHAKDAPKSAETNRPGGEQGKKVQLSEEKRSSVQRAFNDDKRLNRASNVNITVSIGTRVPRQVRLAPVPVTIISLVPEYRSYRYVVIDDRICIVEPTTYEIVDVIEYSSQTAGRSGHPVAALTLSERDREILLREIDLSSGSTMGLGALNEGEDVPRGADVRVFSPAIVRQVPSIQGYRYFTAEDRLVIVDPSGRKVQLVIAQRR